MVGEGANVGTWAFLAEGAVLRPSRSVPDSTLSSGIPARVVGEHATEKTKSLWRKRKEQLIEVDYSNTRVGEKKTFDPGYCPVHLI